MVFIGSLLASCSGLPLPDPTEPNLNPASIVGTWVDQDGSSMTFSADQKVTVHHLDLRAETNGENKSCGFVSGTGSWQLSTDSGNPTTRGYLVDLELGAPVDEVCGAVILSSDDTNPSVGLCVSNDPDDPCGTSPEYFKASAAGRHSTT